MHIFNTNSLEIFDIVLVRFPEDRTSNFIRKFCNSNFSHGIIYLGNNSFVEAFKPIVTLFSSQRYYFDDLENLVVLRLCPESKEHFDIAKAEICLRSLTYNNYSDDILTAIRKRNISETIIKDFKNTNKWFGSVVCSSLITLPYYAGGIDISKNDEPYYANFGDIENDNRFVDVTSNVLHEYSGLLPENTFDYFSLETTGSILEKQAGCALKLNQVVEDIFIELKANKDNYQDIRIEESDLKFSNWEDIFPYLTRWFYTQKGKEIDNKVYNEIVKSEYYNLWFEESHINEFIFFPINHFEKNINGFCLKDQPIDFFRSIKQSMEETLIKIIQDEDNMAKTYITAPCKTFHVLLNMYNNFEDQLRTSISHYNGIIDLKENSDCL
ncbi:hypothetical protein [Flavobacterium cheongpyeongense]|nr:hypothetical protein [Flavobacterium cheongpyeongense]